MKNKKYKFCHDLLQGNETEPGPRPHICIKEQQLNKIFTAYVHFRLRFSIPLMSAFQIDLKILTIPKLIQTIFEFISRNSWNNIVRQTVPYAGTPERLEGRWGNDFCKGTQKIAWVHITHPPAKKIVIFNSCERTKYSKQGSQVYMTVCMNKFSL